jgi:hypothetical protein
MRQTPLKHVHIILLVALCVLIPANSALGHTATTAGASLYRDNAVGITVGVPQTIALTYERALGSSLAARIHIGSAVLFSSGGARVQWGHNRTGVQPYIFAGATFIHSVAEGYGDPKGTAGYIWLGPGLSLRHNRWVAYTEVGALLGGSDDRGLGDDWVFPFSPVIAVGLMIRFQ